MAAGAALLEHLGRAKKKNWIKGAIKRPGAFRKKAKKAGMSTAAFAEKNDNKPGRIGKQARLAETLMGFGHGNR